MADLPHANASTTTTSPPESHAHIRLACQACQRKKIKCDRTFPCGQCVKSSLDCVPSSRKQRARHAGKRAVDGELRSRIAKLESLVESLSSEGASLNDRAPTDDTGVPTPLRTNSVEIESPRLGKYAASSFWSSLSTEVAALRETLEEDDEDDALADTPDGYHSSPGTINTSSNTEHDLIICPPGRVYVMPGALADPPLYVQKQLNSYFLENVERMMKIFHTPSIRGLIEDDAPYLGHLSGSPEHNALKRLAWFAALNSLSEEQALAVTGHAKGDLLPKYKRHVEILLSQCDVVGSNDLATLQCFLLFTAVSRTTDASRRSWVTLSMLVQVANAMHLHHDDHRATPYIRETRRRLWHYIRFMDKYSALDRGTIPFIRQDEHTTPLPTCTDDSLFGPDSTSIPIVTGRHCDMSLSIMCFEACSTIEGLIVPESKNDMTWEQRYQIAADLANHLDSQLLVYRDAEDPFLRLHYVIGRSMSTAMLLRAVRPMQRHVASVPPPVQSPYVLQLAVDQMKESKSLIINKNLEPWRWMKWVPWHTLACALAGLCSVRGTELADEAWSLVEPAYQFCAQYIADGQDGMLWRPIQKLYKKAHAFKAADSSLTLPQAVVAETKDKSESTMSDIPTVDHGMLHVAKPASLDYLSTGFSSMAPFAVTSSMQQPALLPPNPVVTAGFDFNNSTFNQTDWGDWAMVMDDYADPMPLDSASLTNLGLEDWKWNAAPGSTFGGL